MLIQVGRRFHTVTRLSSFAFIYHTGIRSLPSLRFAITRLSPFFCGLSRKLFIARVFRATATILHVYVYPSVFNFVVFNLGLSPTSCRLPLHSSRGLWNIKQLQCLIDVYRSVANTCRHTRKCGRVDNIVTRAVEIARYTITAMTFVIPIMTLWKNVKKK